MVTYYGKGHNWSDTCKKKEGSDERIGYIEYQSKEAGPGVGTEILNSKQDIGVFLSKLEPLKHQRAGKRRCGACDGCRQKDWWCENSYRPDKELCPIAIFGYSMMIRGVSLRPSRESDTNRVPTHMVLWMGNGMSLEKYLQAAGRGSYTNVRSEIKHTTVLARKVDLDAAKAYPHLMKAIHDLLKDGTKLCDIMKPGGPLAQNAQLCQPFLDESMKRHFGYKRVNIGMKFLEPLSEDDAE